MNTPPIPNPPDKIANLQRSLAPLLTPLSNTYRSIMRLRAMRLQARAWRAPVPCISVGNISWGGSGKTPVVSWLLDWAEGAGFRPAVLSRGYKGKPPHLPFEVEVSGRARETGDEPLLLKRAHPHCRIVTDPNRIRAARAVCLNSETDLLILDDGFQHLYLHRDVNLCLLTSADLETQWDRVIPAGSWREGVEALQRADAFLINAQVDDDETLEPLARIKLTQLGKPLFFFQTRATGIRNMRSGERKKSLQDIRFLLVAAVARPASVFQTCIRDLGNRPVSHLFFPDHHAFDAADWKKISTVAREQDCTHIVCTSKDAVKLETLADERLWFPEMKTNFSADDAPVFRAWLDRLNLHSRIIHDQKTSDA